MNEGNPIMRKPPSPNVTTGGGGALITSLDFELYWGMRDRLPLSACRELLLGARAVIPQLLARFRGNHIHATWATVGFLFFENKLDLKNHLPAIRPTYQHAAFSPYAYLDEIGENEQQDPFHYAYSLLRRIQDTPSQEIGSHTFSHYYCLEAGQTMEQFAADLDAAQHTAQRLGVTLESLVFPRNQFSDDACRVCWQKQIRVVRGSQRGWAYRAVTTQQQTLLPRAIRLIDSCINLTGHHPLMRQNHQAHKLPYNARASSFLRAYSDRLAWLSSWQLRRLIKSMTYAAKTGADFHLWWHPHNFGVYPDRNLARLDTILAAYQALRERYGMRSLTMGEWAREQSA